MMNLFRGERCSRESFVNQISDLGDIIAQDLAMEILDAEIVIDAVDRLANSVTKEDALSLLKMMGIGTQGIEAVLKHTLEDMKREALAYKLKSELVAPLGEWITSNDPNGTERKSCYLPLGVLMHIGAGNTIGLSAFSVIEGLLTGNINILKLPEGESGISYFLLEKLIQIEPRLKPYIYVTNLPSSDEMRLQALAEVSDAVVVWGSDATIKALRTSLPANKPMIEWGHKISFAYFSECETTDADLKLLAEEVCITNQLYCSSPQCVFYEIPDQAGVDRVGADIEGADIEVKTYLDEKAYLDDFARRLASTLCDCSNRFPQTELSFEGQAKITFLHQTLSMEGNLKGKFPLTDADHSYGVLIADESTLRTSPLFRNLWVVPIKRSDLIKMLRPHIGHLQTVGLSVPESIKNDLLMRLYRSGVTKIAKCGEMYLNKPGEAHDGKMTLSHYVKKVDNRQ